MAARRVFGYERLEIWQMGMQITKQTYKRTMKEGVRKDYGYIDQMRRCSVSIVSNIAEGYERNNPREFAYFLRIGKASAGELATQLMIGVNIGYFAEEEIIDLITDIHILMKKIGKLLSSLQKSKS